MSKRFENKVCIVTGAAQGIGRGVALRLASEGAKIVMADFSPLVEDVLGEITANGGEATTIQADLESYQGAQAAIDKALDTYGRIDVLVNNVGGAIWMKPLSTSQKKRCKKKSVAHYFQRSGVAGRYCQSWSNSKRAPLSMSPPSPHVVSTVSPTQPRKVV